MREVKIAIYSKKLDDSYLGFIELLLGKLLTKNVEVFVYKDFYKELKQKIKLDSVIKIFTDRNDVAEVDYMFSIGGDGTLLKTITFVRDNNIPVLGINTGRLGFLTSITTDEVDNAINDVLTGDFDLDARTLLEIETEGNLFGDINYALNEITVQKRDTSSMINYSGLFK